MANATGRTYADSVTSWNMQRGEVVAVGLGNDLCSLHFVTVC